MVGILRKTQNTPTFYFANKKTLQHHFLSFSCKKKKNIKTNERNIKTYSLSRCGPFGGSCQIHGSIPMPQSESDDLSNIPDVDTGCGIGVGRSSGIKSPIINNPAFSHSRCPPEVHRSCFCVRFIAEHTKLLEDSTKVTIFKKNSGSPFSSGKRKRRKYSWTKLSHEWKQKLQDVFLCFHKFCIQKCHDTDEYINYYYCADWHCIHKETENTYFEAVIFKSTKYLRWDFFFLFLFSCCCLALLELLPRRTLIEVLRLSKDNKEQKHIKWDHRENGRAWAEHRCFVKLKSRKNANTVNSTR